jgi:RNA recognition motif-containing protein
MPKRIYIGNLPYESTEEDIRALFEQHGTVHSVDVLIDRYTGRSRGFGFVEMDDSEAQKAIGELNGADFGGRNLRVDMARERQERSSARSW